MLTKISRQNKKCAAVLNIHNMSIIAEKLQISSPGLFTGQSKTETEFQLQTSAMDYLKTHSGYSDGKSRLCEDGLSAKLFSLANH